MFGRFGPVELILVLVVLLLLFGAKRIPDVARSLGKAMNQFKRGMKETDLDSEEETGQQPGEDERTNDEGNDEGKEE
ncbi:twin-arginine translocase TatA/TatE family subunit [Candidatus Fermentibacteria bacterium]|nr:twin-arginine translocase TatA/TatE family subunit [Candidatus Fermentibacteria bacterium]